MLVFLGFAFKIPYWLVKITLHTQHQYENTVLELTLKTVTSTACWYLSKQNLKNYPFMFCIAANFGYFQQTVKRRIRPAVSWPHQLPIFITEVSCLKSKSFKVTILAFCWLNRQALNECKCTTSTKKATTDI